MSKYQKRIIGLMKANGWFIRSIIEDNGKVESVLQDEDSNLYETVPQHSLRSMNKQKLLKMDIFYPALGLTIATFNPA